MAKRPVFAPGSDRETLVKEIDFSISWHSGFAPSQKKKNINALHNAAARSGYMPLLEVSTKSDDPFGQRLSAFNLKIETDDYGVIPLECAYQGSKIFAHGGPYSDLYFSDGRAAKKDIRLTSSGRLIGFDFLGIRFPLEPMTAFYDWLYVTSLAPRRETFFAQLDRYAGFTDIEFNPEKSINCQARSCALFVALMRTSSLEAAVRSPDAFIELLRADKNKRQESQRALAPA
jgi:hypothetical protein